MESVEQISSYVLEYLSDLISWSLHIEYINLSRVDLKVTDLNLTMVLQYKSMNEYQIYAEKMFTTVL